MSRKSFFWMLIFMLPISIALAVQPAFASKAWPWKRNGLDIYYTKGNVGIGTMSPNAFYLLEVAKPGGDSRVNITGANGYLNIDRTGGGNHALVKFSEGGAEKWFVGLAGGPGEAQRFFSIKQTQLGAPEFVINTSGNVGIGTSTPGNILTVQQGSATDPIADSWQVYSSRRYKTDIHTLKNALAKVEQLRGVTYKGKKDGQDNIGLIAEEVGKVVPQVVAYEANGKDARSVDYARLVALLVEAVKEQQKTIEAMQQRLDVAESASHLSVSSLLERVRQLETHAGIQADTGKQLSSR